MRYRNLIVILTWLLATAGQAADNTDRFSIRGAGLLTCDIYVSEREERSEAYLMIGGWLDGYITGVNQYAPDTYDATSFESTELLSIVIDNHCQQNPEDRLFSVVNSILAELHDNRLQQSSPTSPIQVGGREIRLYRSTIERIQIELQSRGYFNAGCARLCCGIVGSHGRRTIDLRHLCQ